MEDKGYLGHYRLSLGRNWLPLELHRNPAETTYRAQETRTGREVVLDLAPRATAAAAWFRISQPLSA